MPRHIYLVRHGEPEAGYTKRYLRRLNPGLSQFGREQASRITDRLCPLAPRRIIASPLRRAADTAEIIAAACGIPMETNNLLLEINFGKLEGLTFKEASAIYPGATGSWQALSGDFSFPGGENFADFTLRASRMADQVRACREENVVLVAHGGILRGILCNLLAVEADGPLRFRLAYAALTMLEMDSGGGAVLTGFNVGRDVP